MCFLCIALSNSYMEEAFLHDLYVTFVGVLLFHSYMKEVGDKTSIVVAFPGQMKKYVALLQIFQNILF